MLIGMSEAAKRMGLTARQTALVLLRKHNVPVVQIHSRAYAVDEADLAAYLVNRPTVGRPRKVQQEQQERPGINGDTKSGGASETAGAVKRRGRPRKTTD